MEYKKQIKKVHTGHFAECNTWQRGALPSVRVITLGKEAKPGHRFRDFAECYVVALGKEAGFAECRIEHSAKSLTWGPSLAGSLPSVPEDTRQRCILCRVSSVTLDKDAVSVTRHCNGCFSLPSAPWYSANLFAECPRKSTRQRRLC
jgi:hypothetical protein